jgi:hypothetical protein
MFRFITFENKYLFFKEWINSGIFFVNDIIDKNGNIKDNPFFSQIHLNILVVSVSNSKILSQLIYLPMMPSKI